MSRFGQMCWVSSFGKNEEKMLHLRLDPHQPWQPYFAYPQFSVLDYPVPGGSKGWATYQKLIKSGWTLVPTAQAQATSVDTSLAA